MNQNNSNQKFSPLSSGSILPAAILHSDAEILRVEDGRFVLEREDMETRIESESHYHSLQEQWRHSDGESHPSPEGEFESFCCFLEKRRNQLR